MVIQCRKTVGNSIKLVLFKATQYLQSKVSCHFSSQSLPPSVSSWTAVKELQVLLLSAACSSECGQHVMSCILPVPVYLSYALWWGSSCIEVCLDVVLSTGTKTDHCFNKPCLLHGECISLPDRYECKCAAGYSGNNCEINNGENEIWVCNRFIFPDYEMLFSLQKTKDRLNSIHQNVVEQPAASWMG